MTGIVDYVKGIVDDAVDRAEKREFCRRCGEELFVMAYVIQSDTHPWHGGKFCHDCCPHGTTMEVVKLEQ